MLNSHLELPRKTWHLFLLTMVSTINNIQYVIKSAVILQNACTTLLSIRFYLLSESVVSLLSEVTHSSDKHY